MEIVLDNVVPEPLADFDLGASDIWASEVRFAAGERVFVNAPSGMGKSTLLSIVFGTRFDYRGTVGLDGVDARDLGLDDWAEMRQRRLSMVFQGVRLFADLTGLDNLLMKAQLTGYATADELTAMAERLGVADVLQKKSRFMSFGQRQRLAVVRALAQPFDWLCWTNPSVISTRRRGGRLRAGHPGVRRNGAGLILTSLGEPYAFAYDRSFNL